MSNVYIFVPVSEATTAMYNRSFTKQPRLATYPDGIMGLNKAYLVFGVTKESLSITTAFDSYEWLSEEQMRAELAGSNEDLV